MKYTMLIVSHPDIHIKPQFKTHFHYTHINADMLTQKLVLTLVVWDKNVLLCIKRLQMRG